MGMKHWSQPEVFITYETRGVLRWLRGNRNGSDPAPKNLNDYEASLLAAQKFESLGGGSFMNFQIEGEYNFKCECCDAGCPVHSGKTVCANLATTRLHRVDQCDVSGTKFCRQCGDDAMDSGLFRNTNI